MTEKTLLRQRTLRRLREQSEKSRQKKSLVIGKRLFRTESYRRAQLILCYVAIRGEVETRPILEQALFENKRVFVPVVTDKARRHMVVAEIKDLKKDLSHKGAYGIPHPLRLLAKEISLKKLDLIVVPGVAFDAKGNRLGRGLGYFDRFLERVPETIPCVSLAFRFQMVREIPMQSHDRAVQKVITE